jgi:hypothetical protein
VIAFGDAFHSPIQITHPLWETPSTTTASTPTSLRDSLVLELAIPDTIGFGVNFADVPFGRVRIEGGQSAWHPIDACQQRQTDAPYPPAINPPRRPPERAAQNHSQPAVLASLRSGDLA